MILPQLRARKTARETCAFGAESFLHDRDLLRGSEEPIFDPEFVVLQLGKSNRFILLLTGMPDTAIFGLTLHFFSSSSLYIVVMKTLSDTVASVESRIRSCRGLPV